LVIALAQIAADAGQDEAMSALSHGLGETALIDGKPLDGSLDQAAEQFSRTLVLLLQGHDAPFERAESQCRLASVLVAAGRRDEAVEHLLAAYRTACRLGAKPLTKTSLPAPSVRWGELNDG
jgi:hypothetical protein